MQRQIQFLFIKLNEIEFILSHHEIISLLDESIDHLIHFYISSYFLKNACIFQFPYSTISENKQTFFTMNNYLAKIRCVHLTS
jgi:hypothetical protein